MNSQKFINKIYSKLFLLLARKASYKFFIKNWLPQCDLKTSTDVIKTMRFSQSVKQAVLSGPPGRRITVVAPHCDDEVIGPGGTLVHAVDRGARVSVIYVASAGRDSHAANTLREETLACARQGGFHPIFLDYAIRKIPIDQGAVEAFSDALAASEPECLLVPFLLDDHDDHRRISHLLLEAYRAGRLNPKLPVWCYQVYSVVPGNVLVDITEVVDRKAELIRFYRSQMQHRDWVHFALGLNAFNVRLMPRENRPRYAEAFFVVPLEDYMKICASYFDQGPAACYSEPNYLEIVVPE